MAQISEKSIAFVDENRESSTFFICRIISSVKISLLTKGSVRDECESLMKEQVVNFLNFRTFFRWTRSAAVSKLGLPRLIFLSTATSVYLLFCIEEWKSLLNGKHAEIRWIAALLYCFIPICIGLCCAFSAFGICQRSWNQSALLLSQLQSKVSPSISVSYFVPLLPSFLRSCLKMQKTLCLRLSEWGLAWLAVSSTKLTRKSRGEDRNAIISQKHKK